MRVVLFAAILATLLGGCGGSSATPDGGGSDGPGMDARMHVDDGAPTRLPCTSTFGNALSTTFGRLDGILVAIVPPSGGGCNADNDHVHLQIRANGAVYDVAITLADGALEDVHSKTFEHALLGPVWAEGWHTGLPIDYPALGIHAADVPLRSKAQLASEITADLQTANHISVYGVGYGPGGAHLVHRNGNLHDGLVVTDPLSTPGRVRLFSFTNQAF